MAEPVPSPIGVSSDPLSPTAPSNVVAPSTSKVRSWAPSTVLPNVTPVPPVSVSATEEVSSTASLNVTVPPCASMSLPTVVVPPPSVVRLETAVLPPMRPSMSVVPVLFSATALFPSTSPTTSMSPPPAFTVRSASNCVSAFSATALFEDEVSTVTGAPEVVSASSFAVDEPNVTAPSASTVRLSSSTAPSNVVAVSPAAIVTFSRNVTFPAPSDCAMPDAVSTAPWNSVGPADWIAMAEPVPSPIGVSSESLSPTTSSSVVAPSTSSVRSWAPVTVSAKVTGPLSSSMRRSAVSSTGSFSVIDVPSVWRFPPAISVRPSAFVVNAPSGRSSPESTSPSAPRPTGPASVVTPEPSVFTVRSGGLSPPPSTGPPRVTLVSTSPTALSNVVSAPRSTASSYVWFPSVVTEPPSILVCPPASVLTLTRGVTPPTGPPRRVTPVLLFNANVWAPFTEPVNVIDGPATASTTSTSTSACSWTGPSKRTSLASPSPRSPVYTSPCRAIPLPPVRVRSLMSLSLAFWPSDPTRICPPPASKTRSKASPSPRATAFVPMSRPESVMPSRSAPPVTLAAPSSPSTSPRTPTWPAMPSVAPVVASTVSVSVPPELAPSTAP